MYDQLDTDWFTNTDPRKLSNHVVDFDRWDKEDFEQVLGEMALLRKKSDDLASMSPTGGMLLEDGLYTFLKAEPRLKSRQEVGPAGQRNWQVLSEVMDLPEWHRLHAETKGDPYFAGMASTVVAPTMEQLLSQTQEDEEQAEDLQKKMEELSDARTKLDDLQTKLDELPPTEDGEEPSEEQAQLEGEIEETQGQVDGMTDGVTEAGQKLERSLAAKSADIRRQAQQALAEAADQVSGERQAAECFGTEPGEFTRMSAEEHVRLARQLENTKLKQIAELVGAMKIDFQGIRQTKVNYNRDELYSLEYGRDLGRVLPSEFAKLRHPIRRREFFRAFAENRLVQYELRGIEKKSRGGIYFLEDGSGSMGGMREIFAKAAAIYLIKLAKEQGRPFVGIMFGGPGQVRVFAFNNPEDFTTEAMIAWAETFLNSSGTDFKTPLAKALELLQAEFATKGSTEGDIVFATDGECSVDETWFEHFKSEQKRLEFATYGLLIGGAGDHYKPSVHDICDGRVATVEDLYSGRDARIIFGL